jgi:hypothetical protein
MPTIVTRGTASARAFGFGRTPTAAPPPPPPPGPPPPPPPPAPVLQTVVFDSSTSWTIPVGVNNLISVTLNGGLYAESGGGFAYTTGGSNFGFYSQQGTSQAGSVDAFYTYAQAGSVADAALAAVNSGGTGDRTVVFDQRRSFYNPNTGGYYDQADFVTLRVRGTATPASGPWDNRSSSPVQGIGNGWYFGIEVYYPPSGGDGAPSSAFGLSVVGGTAGNPAPTASYSNVGVSSGATYNIEVGGGGGGNGSVIVEFYQ